MLLPVLLLPRRLVAGLTGPARSLSLTLRAAAAPTATPPTTTLPARPGLTARAIARRGGCLGLIVHTVITLIARAIGIARLIARRIVRRIARREGNGPIRRRGPRRAALAASPPAAPPPPLARLAIGPEGGIAARGG